MGYGPQISLNNTDMLGCCLVKIAITNEQDLLLVFEYNLENPIDLTLAFGMDFTDSWI